MRQKVMVIDTSVLCVWLKVAGMKTCGPNTDRWDFERVNDKFTQEESDGTLFIIMIKATL